MSDLSDLSDESDKSDQSDGSDWSDWSDKSDDRFGLKLLIFCKKIGKSYSKLGKIRTFAERVLLYLHHNAKTSLTAQ